MGLSDIVSRLAELAGATAIWLRRSQGAPGPTFGASPTIPPARPRAPFRPSRCRPRKAGRKGRRRSPRPGLKVNAFASGLKHPRWIHVLSGGEVLVAEALIDACADRELVRLRHGQHDEARRRRRRRARTGSRFSCDADGDGVAEVREPFLDGLKQPFGMALLGDTFYVGNTDGVVAFPYSAGAGASPRRGAS